MPDPLPAPAPAEQAPAGAVGLLATALRIINGMTNERLMLVSLITVLGFVVYYGQKGQSEQVANTARLYEEGRESDRQHCAQREEKIDAARHNEAREMRQWYAQQAEIQRRHESEREDKLRLVVSALADNFERLRLTIASLTQSVTDLMSIIKKN